MRLAAWVPCALLALPVAGCGVVTPSEETASLALAMRLVEAVRGDEHRARVRVLWPALEDETPPDGAEVVLVRGCVSYQVTRLVLNGAGVEAGSVLAARSWFYNRKGESFAADEFDVPAGRFALAWNAMRRLLAASDERIAPEPDDHPHRMTSIGPSSHASADWIRAQARVHEPPLHCADRASHMYDWDDVRLWDGLRDQAIFEAFEELIPEAREERRPAEVARWTPFAAEQIRVASRGIDVEGLRRDDELIDTCLRVLGQAGDESCEAAVAGFARTLAGLDGSEYWVESARGETSRAASRLRLRLHWDHDDVVRTLRALPHDTWPDEDLDKWIREKFRADDPVGWAEFLVEEATRHGATPDDVAAAAAGLRGLPAERVVPILHELITRNDPYVRLEAALALHELAPGDSRAGSTVVALALDRTIACEWRSDLTDRWSRNRALVAALEWADLTPAQLRAHLLAPEVERPEFLAMARSPLAGTPEALSDAMARDCWGRILDEGEPSDVYAAVRHLMFIERLLPKARLLEALDRVLTTDEFDRKQIERLREQLEELAPPEGSSR